MNHEFCSDNTSPAAPEMLAALIAANDGAAAAYGEDEWTARLQSAACASFERDYGIAAFPTLNGKAANHLSLLAVTEPGGLVLCHEHAHILVDEDGGPERYTQARFIGIEDDGRGKIALDALRRAIGDAGPIAAQSALSITNATEAATVYSPDELRALAKIARAAGLRVHLDGARIANAATSLGCSLADLTWCAGIDILSLGITKNGGISAEAVVTFNDAVAARFIEQRAWTGHVASKMRFLSAQVIAGLEGDAWRARATNANATAKLLAAELAAIPGVRIVRPVEANHVYAGLPAQPLAALNAAGYVAWDIPAFGPNVVRFVTNWSTTETAVHELVEAMRRC